MGRNKKDPERLEEYHRGSCRGRGLISEVDDLDKDEDEENLGARGMAARELREKASISLEPRLSCKIWVMRTPGQVVVREEVDTEENPVRGAIVSWPNLEPCNDEGNFGVPFGGMVKDDDEEEELEADEVESVIGDDWVDPSSRITTSTGAPPPPAMATATTSNQKPTRDEYVVFQFASAVIVKPGSVGLQRGFSFLAAESSPSSSATIIKGCSRKGKKQVPLLAPLTACSYITGRLSTPIGSAASGHNDYHSFISNSETTSLPVGRPYTSTGSSRNVSMKSDTESQEQGQHQHRMYNARAKDAGGTQSGGVK
ncbi:hypothetical protein CPC08DRAFT_754993 [Agrocybe pediades]|nr:hypothetical protein CPC08DRAFT_754993 [Agrocybe pediades]